MTPGPSDAEFGEELGAVCFAAGGTGGHLTPMLAIAEALRARRPNLRTRFLCSSREIDARVLEPTGEPWTPLPAQPPVLHPWKFAKFVGAWGPSVRATRHAIRALRQELQQAGLPARIELVTTGGFVAAPAVQGARVERVPVTLVNLDAVPGKASRWIAPKAGRVLTTLPVPDAPRTPVWTRIPPIVRPGAGFDATPEQARAELGLEPDRPVLLITGGSQGARSLNNFVLALLDDAPELFAGWQIVHQTGPGEMIDRARAAWARAGVPGVVEPYLDRFGLAWRVADLAIARGGGGTVTDAWRAAVPSIILPYPDHRDRHQHANAAPLVEVGGAVVLEDRVEPALNLREHGERVRTLLRDAAARERMRAGLRTLGPTEGAERLADLLIANA